MRLSNGWLLIAALLVGTTILPAEETLGGEPTPRDLARQALASRAAAQEIHGWLNQRKFPDEAGQQAIQRDLAAAMVADVAAWRDPARARNQSREWIQNRLSEAWENRVNDALKRAREQSPLSLDRGEVLRQVDPQYEQARNRMLESALNSGAEPWFEAARRLALEQYRVDWLSRREDPDFDSLDPRILELDPQRESRLGALTREQFQPLVPWLREVGSSPGPVFAELDSWVLRLADEQVDGFHRQYLDQVEVILPWKDPALFAAALRTRVEFEATLQEALNQQITANPQASPPVYPVFSATRSLAEDLALHAERERYQKFLQDHRLLQPSPDHIRQTILETPAAHRDPRASANRFIDSTLREQLPEVREEYLGGLSPKVTEPFIADLATDKPLGKITREVVSQRLNDILPGVRAEIATLQAKWFAPNLVAGEDIPESLVVWVHDKKWPAALQPRQAVQALEAADSWRGSENESGQLLNESQEKLRDLLQKQLSPARQSLEKQLRTVRSLETDWLPRLHEAVDRGVRFERIKRDWESELDRRWQPLRAEVPSPWQDLFDRTMEDLDKTVRQLYDTRIEALQTASSPAASPPGGEEQREAEATATPQVTEVQTPEAASGEIADPADATGAGSGAQPEAGILEALTEHQGEADAVLLFEDVTEDLARLHLATPTGSHYTTVDFNPSVIGDSAQTIAQTVTPTLATLAAAQNTDPRELKITFQINSPQIRHQMSIQLRQEITHILQQQAGDRGHPVPTLIWQDNLPP